MSMLFSTQSTLSEVRRCGPCKKLMRCSASFGMLKRGCCLVQEPHDRPKLASKDLQYLRKRKADMDDLFGFRDSSEVAQIA